MSSKCSISDDKICDLTKYNDHDECILHSPKNQALKDYHKSFGMLETFYNHLFDYILDEIFKITEEDDLINKMTIRNYLRKENISNPEKISRFVKNKKIVFNLIAFPVRNSRESFDYLQVLQQLGKIHFNNCSFYLPSLELSSVQCFFQDCKFYDNWFLYDYDVLENEDNVVYQSSLFNASCSVSTSEYKKIKLSNSQFTGCIFNSGLTLENVHILKALFKDLAEFNSKIKLLKLTNCKFEERFILNNYCIEEVYLKNINFIGKFEFKYCNTKEFSVDNCNFDKLSEFYKTNFIKFRIFKSIFSDYTGFEKCKFGITEESSNKEYITNFEYVTFLSFINFRKTHFSSGLDLENTNIKESPNFLKTSINTENTSRETFRIIKHSFDKIGNTIEANKFFSFEMKKHKRNLSKKNKYSQEWFIFTFNGLISNFGQSYIRPFLLLLTLTIIYALIFTGYESNLIKTIFTDKNNVYYLIIDTLNFWANNIFPFKKSLPIGLEFLSLSFLIIQSTLIWHFVVAVKRHTKR